MNNLQPSVMNKKEYESIKVNFKSFKQPDYLDFHVIYYSNRITLLPSSSKKATKQNWYNAISKNNDEDYLWIKCLRDSQVELEEGLFYVDDKYNLLPGNWALVDPMQD